ncbi:hypothetical protein DdX_03699 [Ditylenchus destructor]|uniref:Uncharacterized protein n=1 Tax=Ditylenchus destructor TaxID=166010 RepID=A0AAD4NFL9_9BILA|nr:hypothetical protein DdX_03699 [Ditylenchus destructor]
MLFWSWWSSLVCLLLSLTIFTFNALLLLATSSNPKLHTTSNILASNMWLANCIHAAVSIFHNLLEVPEQSTYVRLPVPSLKIIGSSVMFEPINAWEYTSISGLGAQTLAALFNTTVSLLALIAMAFVQLVGKRRHDWMPTSVSFRISMCIWSVVLGVVFFDFALLHITRSFGLLVAFQLALLSILLVFNLVLHPVNLFMASRSTQDSHLDTSITESLWLLMHSLSFTLLAMMLVWEGKSSSPSKSNQHSRLDEMYQLITLQLAAYMVHCIANPMISLLRDPRLTVALGKFIYCSSRQDYNGLPAAIEDSRPALHQWFLPEMSWIMRNIPPPPVYRSPSWASTRTCDEYAAPFVMHIESSREEIPRSEELQNSEKREYFEERATISRYRIDEIK